MYDAKNIKAFKPTKATVKEWKRMEKDGDKVGLCLAKTTFIKEALWKVSGFELYSEADRLESKIMMLYFKGKRHKGLTDEETAKAVTYYKMALAIAMEEAGSTAEVEIDR